MLEVVTPSLLIVAGICFHAGASHLFLALRRKAIIHLIFGLMCLLVFVFALCSAQLYQSTTTGEYITHLRHTLLLGDLWNVAFVWFVASYSKNRPVRFLIAHNALCVVVLLLNYSLPHTTLFAEVRELELHTLPWGETVQHVTAVPSFLALLEYLPFLLSFGFAYVYAVRQFTRGLRSSGLFLAVATSLQFLGLVLAAIVDYAGFNFIYVGEFAFLGFIFVMAFSLAHEFEIADTALRRSEGRFRQMAETIGEVFYLADPVEDRILYVSPGYEALTGRRHDELEEKSLSWLDDIVPHDRAKVAHSYDNLRQGVPFDEEYQIERADGSARWVSDRAFPIIDEEGVVHLAAGVARDITDRKRTEKALVEREERLRAIMNTAADAIITIDQRGTIENINPATEKMFGYSRAELVGQSVSILMPPPYCHEHGSYLSRYLKTGQARIIGAGREVTGMRKDSSTFPADLAVSEVKHLGLFTGIIRDVTERKSLQKHVLEVAAEEQRRLGQELHDGIAQELTGLSLIAGTLLSVLKVTEESEAENSEGAPDDSECRRAREIAARLLDGVTKANQHVHRLSHGIMPVQVDSGGLCSALRELVAATDVQENVSCRFACSGPVTVANNTTASHLYRIAQEALNNALRHSRADQISISLSKKADEVMMAITDNGIGFDPAVEGSASTASGGMGLRTMAYRAGMIGAVLRIRHNAPAGTIVSCTVSEG